MSCESILSTDPLQLAQPPKGWLHPSYSHRTLRLWQREATLLPFHLMYPVFVCDGSGQKQAIASMPEQFRWSVDRLDELIAPLVAKGLTSVLLFGVLSDSCALVKDAIGNAALSPQSPVVCAIAHLRRKYPTLFVAADVCLCAYTSHGHCGVLDAEGFIDNAQSIERLAAVACHYAAAGAHMVAPSDMMDGRTREIKAQLFSRKLAARCSVMSYAAKFCSAFYGPFRDACHSAPAKVTQKVAVSDRSSYQLPAASRSLALAAAKRCANEGADVIMVKPGICYLDVLRDCAQATLHKPLAVYQVSGEYCMLWHAAAAGAVDLKQAVTESCVAFRRAGASLIISYYTPRLLDWLQPTSKL